ncbi:toprim domain-containing protein [Maribacter sp. PR1]|uniref:Toprim domain-containing protein n=1 Tax=Maribacter cobaltidurans TaxID=1178778 RepID=A0ABU7IQA0_9FLAO|nr:MULTISPECIES: toprim domain-containing protein [Maribacter]MDC6387737.1 toprim domain-containing protein [Maribacter sp. PR1]MEE1975126.1 toprim domain-containing protein [Maribacter cobaltidurans]
MKKERTNKLTCERARAFPIEKALAKLGHLPTRSTEKEAWFLSPFRPETQASFKVSKKLNRWYDHGAGIGGNVIDLICQIDGSSVREALRFLEQGQTSFSFQQRPPVGIQKDTGLEILHARPIRHYGLIKYLSERKISISTASTICREVHHLHKGRRYFAIGLKNDSGGWELRNKYYKNSSSPKDITHIKNGNRKLIVTEGMFDLLSILEGTEESNLVYDFLVLNSTALVKKAIKLMDPYDRIDLYLDNDTTGKATTQNLMARSNNCLDKSSLYEGYKDMNEWLIFKAKNGFGQEAQDVFLLPQKRSCFAPGGRKVKKK